MCPLTTGCCVYVGSQNPITGCHQMLRACPIMTLGVEQDSKQLHLLYI